jgi:hypothetical protein
MSRYITVALSSLLPIGGEDIRHFCVGTTVNSSQPKCTHEPRSQCFCTVLCRLPKLVFLHIGIYIAAQSQSHVVLPKRTNACALWIVASAKKINPARKDSGRPADREIHH